MNCKKTVALCMAIGLILGNYQAFAQTAEELLPKGIQLEEVKGELEKAIEVYQTIVDKFSDNRPIAAKALLHIGLCYEKLGNQEAKKAYREGLIDANDQIGPIMTLDLIIGHPQIERAFFQGGHIGYHVGCKGNKG